MGNSNNKTDSFDVFLCHNSEDKPEIRRIADDLTQQGIKLIPFLDYCAKLILLKKVGGGYIFIHRMLLEYFANLDTSKIKSTKI